MAIEIHAHPRHEAFLPLITFSVILVASFCSRGWLRIRSATPASFSFWRFGAFVSGLFAMWIALGSPLAALDHQLLTAHMLKHLLVMTVAAPLILFGSRSLPTLWERPKWFMGRSAPFGGATATFRRYFLDNAVFHWLAGTGALIVWHIPTLFELGRSSHNWHVVEDTCFLSAGLLFWRPIIGFEPIDITPSKWSAPLYLFLATLPCDILSAFLAFCDRVVYPGYAITTRIFGLSALQDQECAGALMWVWVTFAYLIPAVVLTMQMFVPRPVHGDSEALEALYRPAGAQLVSSEIEVV